MQIIQRNQKSVDFCNHIFQVSKKDDGGKTAEAFSDYQMKCFYSALLIPFQEFEFLEKKKVEKVIVKVIYDSLKKSNEVLKFVTGTVGFVEKAIEYAQKV